MIAAGGLTRHAVGLLSLVLCWSQWVTATSPAVGSRRLEDLTAAIPPRALHALTGSQFAASVSALEPRQRERAILSEILAGNLPPFLRRLVPVELTSRTAGGQRLTATIFVMPDYLAIGSDADFLRIPMNLETALTIAARFAFALPTRKMVDAIYVSRPPSAWCLHRWRRGRKCDRRRTIRTT